MRWRLLPNNAFDGSTAADSAEGSATTGEVLLAAPPGGSTWWPAAAELPPSPEAGGAPIEGLGTLADGAARALGPWVDDRFSAEELAELCTRALPDEPRWVELDEHTWILELFHGPTAAFKDTGARVLAALVRAALEDPASSRPSGRATVIAATTGDTGAAVAAAFGTLAELDVVLLYPRGKISAFQERHLNSFGGSVRTFAVDGDFEDCARIARETTTDVRYFGKRWWLPANSVHPLRLLPQAAHFLWAAQRLSEHGVQRPAFVVPSGNSGHLTAGLAARATGLRASAWLAAHNANRALVDWLATGRFDASPAKATWSNAMDIAAPGNRARLASLLRAEPAVLEGASIDDEGTLQALRQLQLEHGYAACPHTAVGWAALRARRLRDPAWRERPAVLLATAHPAKFAGARTAAGLDPAPLPAALGHLAAAPETSGEALVGGAEELHQRLG